MGSENVAFPERGALGLEGTRSDMTGGGVLPSCDPSFLPLPLPPFPHFPFLSEHLCVPEYNGQYLTISIAAQSQVGNLEKRTNDFRMGSGAREHGGASGLILGDSAELGLD